jgi:tRNA 2-thiouridine synthesizing protein A
LEQTTVKRYGNGMNDDPEVLDLRGLKCPLPALMARRYLTRAQPGTCVLVLTDDPMAPIDVPHMCRTEGFEVVSIEHDGDSARMFLSKQS